MDIMQVKSRNKIQTRTLCLASESTLLTKTLYHPPDEIFPLPEKKWHVEAAQQTLAKQSVKQLYIRKVEDSII